MDEGGDEISVMQGSWFVSGPPEKANVVQATGVHEVGVADVLLVFAVITVVVTVFHDEPW